MRNPGRFDFLEEIEKAEQESNRLYIGLNISGCDDMEMDGGESAADFHVTLLYGNIPQYNRSELEATARDAVREIQDSIPSTLTFDRIGTFDPTESSDGRRVIFARVQPGQLEDAHKRIQNALKKRGISVSPIFPEYNPHMTLAYVDPEEDVDEQDLDISGKIRDITIGITENGSQPEDVTIPLGNKNTPTGCGVLVVRDGKILSGTRIERNSRGKICGPGGHIEEGESPEEAAIREAYEEFGIVCQDVKPLGVQSGGNYGDSAIFICSAFSGTPKTDEKEMTAPQWRTPEEIRESNAYPPFLHSIDLLEEMRDSKPHHDRAVGKSDSFHIYKSDDDKRLVFGWASISMTVDGTQLEDRQQDMIDPDDLEAAAYEYVLNFRDTGEEHIPTMRKKGRLVESCVFTAEKQRAIGIPPGILPVGWWIGFYVDDDEAWEKIKNGTYRMFSIEGKANRIPV